MWFLSAAETAGIVIWICSTATNGLTPGPEVSGEDGVFVESALILPFEKRTAQEQGPCITGKDWQKCILAVPSKEPFARQTIDALRVIFNLPSSTGYHESPPPELELPALNLNATFDKMEAKVNTEVYQNHWSFKPDLMEVKGRKVWEAWSVEKDRNVKSWEGAKLGDEVVMINDQPALEWFAQYTQTSMESGANVDPDSRMRQVEFTVPTGLSRGIQMWNGEELSIQWENGRRRSVPWTVQFTSQMVTDGEFRFNSVKILEKLCFLNQTEMEKMIGPPPSETRKRSKVTRLGESLINRSSSAFEGSAGIQKRQEPAVVERPSGYPLARASGPEFAVESFILRGDPETASIRFGTFREQDRNMFKEFSKGFQNFITKELVSLKKDGVKRLVIDRRTGCPSIRCPEPAVPRKAEISSMNIRWSPTTWALVQNFDNGRYMEYYKDENMQDFKSKDQCLGPIFRDGGWYSPKWKQDFEQYAQESSSIDPKHTGSQPFETENIIVISNGICASPCASFVEGLQEHGVRAVAYGGRPNSKTPMQAVGGTKGGEMIDIEQIYQSLAKAVIDKRYTDSPPSAWMPPAMLLRVLKGSLNLENKFRDGIGTPPQYLYTPPCRMLGFNKDMFVDIMVLWEEARAPMWD
ncbi:unnamed protein product [Tuber aestivum]|uniref:Tail specific protease domain-containing protein n=1 Tax=Tuber aestivum TaxID=59557 RepID=A0A292PMA7_9PEZI|nr:unnamed protein product [Tuber aestivum]